MDTLFGLFFLLDEVVNQIDQERVYQVNEESTPVSDLDNIIDSLFGRNLIDVFDPQLETVPQKPASPLLSCLATLFLHRQRFYDDDVNPSKAK